MPSWTRPRFSLSRSESGPSRQRRHDPSPRSRGQRRGIGHRQNGQSRRPQCCDAVAVRQAQPQAGDGCCRQYVAQWDGQEDQRAHDGNQSGCTCRMPGAWRQAHQSLQPGTAPGRRQAVHATYHASDLPAVVGVQRRCAGPADQPCRSIALPDCPSQTHHAQPHHVADPGYRQHTGHRHQDEQRPQRFGLLRPHHAVPPASRGTQGLPAPNMRSHAMFCLPVMGAQASKRSLSAARPFGPSLVMARLPASAMICCV